MQRLLACTSAVLAATAVLATASIRPTETLVTPNYTVVVTRHCANTEAACAKVSAHIKSKDGRTYVLSRGSTYAAAAVFAKDSKDSKDSKASYATTGYRFKHKKTEYTVLQSGELTITKRGKTITNERGSWSR